MLSVIVRWTVVEGHQRMRARLPQVAAGIAPVVTIPCEFQLRRSHSPVPSNGPHTMVTDTMAPVHLSVVVGQSTSPVALPEPLVACMPNQDGIGRTATQLPSSPQFSSAAKRTKVAKGVLDFFSCETRAKLSNWI